VTVEEIRELAVELRRSYPGDRDFEHLARFVEQHAERFATSPAVSVQPPVANDAAPVVANAVANDADVANAKPKRKRDRSGYMRDFMRRKRAAERKTTS
jgi:hypothetical protein